MNTLPPYKPESEPLENLVIAWELFRYLVVPVAILAVIAHFVLKFW